MNSVILIGRLTRDPEMRFVSGSGTPVTQFNLAVDKNLSKDKKQKLEQQNKPTADFVRIITWGKQAENCANYLSKGLKVAIQGSLSVTTYKSNTGETRFSTDVVAREVNFLEWGAKNSAPISSSGKNFDEDFANDFIAIENDDDMPF